MIPQVLEDQAIVRLHEAQNSRELAHSTFALFENKISNQLLFLALRPMEFELPSISSRPEFQWACDKYIAGGHLYDVWLRRSPVHPGVTAVRHSDYTPQRILKGTLFYKDIMRKVGCEYGASMVAWRDSTWLATLTLFKNAKQGDITDKEMEQMSRWQLHFSSAVKRIAGLYEAGLGNKTLETFIWGLPTAAIVLDWNLRILHYNARAGELSALWRFGESSKHTKKPRAFRVPGDILAAIERYRPNIEELKPNRPSAPKIVPAFTFKHPTLPELEANISFLPSKSLTVSKGTFLISFYQNEKIFSRKDVYQKLCKLSRRERDVVKFASFGLNSQEIAKQLGTTSITVRTQLHDVYKKLGIRSRYELISAFATNEGVDQIKNLAIIADSAGVAHLQSSP